MKPCSLNNMHANEVCCVLIVEPRVTVMSKCVLFKSAVNWCDYLVPVKDEWMSIEHWLHYTDKWNQSTQRQICPSATLSTIHPTWTCLELNCGLHGESPTTNWLSHNSALGENGQDFLKTQRNCPWELMSPVITELLNFVLCFVFVV